MECTAAQGLKNSEREPILAAFTELSESHLNPSPPQTVFEDCNSSSSSASWAAISELRTQEEISSFYGGSNGGVPTDVMDEFQLQEQLSFLNDGCPPPMRRYRNKLRRRLTLSDRATQNGLSDRIRW
ncbi:zinc finger CCCH domain-containing protein 53-like [Pyrus ussuriensis x Pyrus communis]|uniref:Zinc finger CCCH domain-containing protein 53-like n=1 Tax=Pyrus ussuriensis x Pyrus communis TaxID=2448454 RepID=A0A5N5I8B7_9ROSA|nr:zinc finger CCCH domain-containing protein 53-like [Pyrus ussuriensis x Pyrus communis]